MNKPIRAQPEHEVAYQDIVALLSRHAPTISAAEMLAIGANMLGKLIAMQDQRIMTSEKAMEIVLVNLRLGNQQALDKLKNSRGSA